jgi:dihydrofolate synthase/folylpolyglutamate synthase
VYLSTVSEWLNYIGSVHVTEIDLGLSRVKEVAERLKVLSPACPVIIVAGTNGKGSTVAGLESIYQTAHFRTGVFTSPFLFRYNEQIRMDGKAVEDDELCQAFETVEKAREDISLTPFEFGTLAAFVLFQKQPLDVWILEVGLGGRLDAVNIQDADVAVITSIAIDHINWLGDTREKIGGEKAGIFREGKPVVCGDDQPPVSLLETAKNLSSPFYQCGRDFHFQETEATWVFANQMVRFENLPINMLAIPNMATVLEVIFLLQDRLPVIREVIDQGLKNVSLPGRIQIVPGPITIIYDVSHNPAAVKWLAAKLASLPCSGKTHAVFSMLEDKDITGSLLNIKNKVDNWYVAPLNTKRASTEKRLKQSFLEAGMTDNTSYFQTLTEAYQAAMKSSIEGDRIIIFGSFYTISEIIKTDLRNIV